MKNTLIFMGVILLIVNIGLCTNKNRALFLKAKESLLKTKETPYLNCNIGELIELAKHADELQHLEYISLNFEANEGSVLPQCIGLFKSITALSIINANLTELPENLGDLENLFTLKLNGNKLKQLPNSIGKLKKLSLLNVSQNNLHSIPDSIGNLKQLKSLYLNDNKIRNLPESIADLSNLKSLYIQNNQLKTLPSSIGDLKKIESIDIEGNDFDSLPDEFYALFDRKGISIYYDEVIFSEKY